MESGSRPPDGPEGPQSPPSPAPGLPGQPVTGPQSPPPSGPPVTGPQSPAPPPPSPDQAPAPQSYGGPVPPGGWDRPTGPAPVGQLASWGSRLGAAMIDGLIIFVPAITVIVALGIGVAGTDEGNEGFGALVAGLILSVLVLVVITFLYAPLLMMRQGEHNGQTIGKQLLNIRVVRTNGQPFNFGSAALREVVLKNLAVGIASSIIPIIPWFLNYFWPLWDDENRALHDMAANTRVVLA